MSCYVCELDICMYILCVNFSKVCVSCPKTGNLICPDIKFRHSNLIASFNILRQLVSTYQFRQPAKKTCFGNMI
jgi:hypothetical protein